MNKAFILIFLLLIFSYSNLFAQKSDSGYYIDENGVFIAIDSLENNTTKQIDTSNYYSISIGLIDSSNILVRSDSALFASIMTDDTFQYKEKKQGDDLFEYLLNQIYRLFSRTVAPLISNSIGKIILIVALLAIIVIVLKVMLGKNFSTFLYKNSNKNIVTLDFEQNIEELDFEKLVDSSIQNRNYREAIRFMFLNILKILAVNNIIKWKIDKTNFDYLNEIQDNELKNRFRNISLIFNYIEYGEFELDEARFSIARKKFDNFNSIWSKL